MISPSLGYKSNQSKRDFWIELNGWWPCYQVDIDDPSTFIFAVVLLLPVLVPVPLLPLSVRIDQETESGQLFLALLNMQIGCDIHFTCLLSLAHIQIALHHSYALASAFYLLIFFYQILISFFEATFHNFFSSVHLTERVNMVSNRSRLIDWLIDN